MASRCSNPAGCLAPDWAGERPRLSRQSRRTGQQAAARTIPKQPSIIGAPLSQNAGSWGAFVGRRQGRDLCFCCSRP
jgi:hypothetical protein